MLESGSTSVGVIHSARASTSCDSLVVMLDDTHFGISVVRCNGPSSSTSMGNRHFLAFSDSVELDSETFHLSQPRRSLLQEWCLTFAVIKRV